MTLKDLNVDCATGRIPLPARAEMSAEQRTVYDEIVAGRRGRVVGPLRVVIHNPDLARDWSSLGARLRYSTSLGPRRSELAIIVTARHWASQVEWSIHAGEAIKAGVSSAVVEAIGRGAVPLFVGKDDAVIYEFTRQLLTDCHVGSATYSAAREHLGDVGVVELTALVGYYSMVAMMLNAHEVPVPQEIDAAPPLLASVRTDLPCLADMAWQSGDGE